MAKYDFGFKFSLVKQVLENGRSYSEVARENELSKSDVRKWVEVYQAHGTGSGQAGCHRVSCPAEF